MTLTDSATSKNAWRIGTPGVEGWTRTARPDDPHKYFMVSADCHTTEGMAFLDGVEPEYRLRVPHMEERENGAQYMITEGNRPQLTRPPAGKTVQDQQTYEKATDNRAAKDRMEDEDLARQNGGRAIEQRIADQALDGIDVELVFPTAGLLCWATPDPVFAMAMCQIEWAADKGYRGVCIGNSPIYGPTEHGKLQYQDPEFEPMWSLLEETGLVVTLHVSTGRDPRASGGNGGAIINYVCHSMATTIEPLVSMIASGVFERHPSLQAGLVESGVGFVPWLLETMDHAYRAHHFWVRPVIPELPSHYFRRNCFATFQIDQVGMDSIEQYDLVDNLLWANYYPHHEGSWPHSADAIERMMGHLSDETRAKVLGLNAARIFGLEVPAR